MPEQPTAYKYFAFISYSRKDSKAAAWLQKRLEWFRFPVKLVPEDRRPPNERYVRPIYLDKNNLEVTSEHYWNNIRRALEESRYLIVLCSPNSANPRPGASNHPVDLEVAHFLKSHSGDNSLTVPIILGGSITSTGADAALCPSLRALGDKLTSRNVPTMVPEGDKDELDAWEQGFVSLVSYLLSLDRAAIGDHIQRESKRQAKVLRRWLVAVGMLTVIATVSAWFAIKESDQRGRLLDDVARSDRLVAFQHAAADDDRTALAYLARALKYRSDSSLPVEAAVPLLQGGLDATPALLMEAHSGPVRCVCFSPDETKIATASEDGTARVWDAHSGSSLIELKGHGGIVLFVEFSPDGQRLVTASRDTTACIWNASTGAIVHKLAGHKQPVWTAHFSPDGSQVLTSSMDYTARIWDAASGTSIYELKGHTGTVAAAEFDRNGRKVCTASSDNTARIWDAKSGQLLRTCKHDDDVNSARFSPDGASIVTASYDTTARIWNVETGNQLLRLSADESPVLDAAFSPDGTRVIYGTSNETARIWDAHDGKMVTSMPTHRGVILTAAFSPDSTLAMTTSKDGTAIIWDAFRGQRQAQLLAHSGNFRSAVFNRNGSTVLTGSDDGSAALWKMQRPLGYIACIEHKNTVWRARFSPDEKRLLTASADGSAIAWDVETGAPLVTMRGHVSGVWDAVFSPDGIRIATASRDRMVRIFEAASGKMLATASGHSDGVTSVAYFNYGKRLISASHDKTARIWDAATGQQLHLLAGHGDSLIEAIVSSDDQTIATASRDKTARLWDGMTGNALAVLRGHTNAVIRLAFSPNGKLVVTASEDNTARIWEVPSGRLLHVLSGHAKKVNCALFSPDGSRIITCSSDNTARIWDTETGTSLAVLAYHLLPVEYATFSRCGRRVLTCSADNTAVLWDAETGSAITSLEGHTNTIGFASFNASGTRIATVSSDFSAIIWPMAEPGHKAPPWFAQLLHFVSGRHIDSNGNIAEISTSQRAMLQQELSTVSTGSEDDFCSQLLRWHLQSSDRRPLFPGGSRLAAEAGNELILRRASNDAAVAASILDSSNPLVELGNVARTGSAAAADALREIAFRHLPDDARTQLRAGEILRDQKQHTRAIQFAERALELRPDDIHAHALRARSLRSLKRHIEAHKEWQMALRDQGAADGKWWEEAALNAAIAGAADDARRWMATAQVFSPDREVALRCAGWTALHLGEFNPACAYFREARSLITSLNTDGLAGLAAAEWKAGNKEEAVKVYEELIALGRKSTNVEDWAIAETLVKKDWHKVEVEPLEQCRIETLRMHPELGTP